jgi:hypothetical protein
MSQGLLLDLTSSAQFSPCRNWRYTLHRRWRDGSSVAFLMFNPSTADETQDDPTIRKCVGFAQGWGYGRLVILNLFAIRGTDPRTVERVQDPVGPLNNYWILKALADDGCRELICAWGCGEHMKRADLARRPAALLAELQRSMTYLDVNCLGVRQDGQPRHPLMLAYSTERREFEVAHGRSIQG